MNEHPLAVLLAGTIMLCFNSKSQRALINDYRELHAKDKTLSEEREKWLVDTNSAIDNFSCLRADQLRPFIAHRPIAVQYFIFERMVMLHVDILNYVFCAEPVQTDALPAETLVRLLSADWDLYKRQVASENSDFDEYFQHTCNWY